MEDGRNYYHTICHHPEVIYDKDAGIDKTDAMFACCLCGKKGEEMVIVPIHGHLCKNHICNGCASHTCSKTYPKADGQRYCEACETHAYLQAS